MDTGMCVCANNKQPVRRAKHMLRAHEENIVEDQGQSG